MSFSSQFATLDEAFNPHPILTKELRNGIEQEAKKQREEQRKEYEKKYPPPPPPTPEQVAEDKRIRDKIFTGTIDFGNNFFGKKFTIGTLCLTSFPCKHSCNGKLQSAIDIYDQLTEAGYTKNNFTITKDQKDIIRHFESQIEKFE